MGRPTINASAGEDNAVAANTGVVTLGGGKPASSSPSSSLRSSNEGESAEEESSADHHGEADAVDSDADPEREQIREDEEE